MLCTALAGNLAAGRALGQPILPQGFVDEVVVPGLVQPVGMAWLPDGRLLVIEQKTANLRLVVNGVATTLFAVPEVNPVGVERGLLGIAVDPSFPDRPYVYLYFSHLDLQPTNYLVMYTLTGDLSDPASSNLQVDPASRFAILTDIPDNFDNHNGGTLRFGPEGLLYVSIGEDTDRCAAQELGRLHGVLLRLNVSALPETGAGPPAKSVLVPADNPFDGPNDNARLTAAFGLRNPFRIDVDSVTGRVFLADVGQNLFEEIDLLEPGALGKNYGWPFREGPVAFSSCPGGNDTPTFTDPIASYDRSRFNGASVISAGVYRPVDHPFDRSFPPEYDGDYFFAEYYQGFLRRIREDAGGTWNVAPEVPGQPNASDWATGISTPADFSIGPDGALYYVSQFGQGGSVHRISFVPGTVLSVGDASGQPGDTGIPVEVKTSAPFLIGSSDLRLDFNPGALEATGVTSDLEGFDFIIDNDAGVITTVSVSLEGQQILAEATLFTVSFNVRPTAAPGCYALRADDGDGIPPNDLAGPVPPVPPAAILFSTAPGSFCVFVCGNGSVETPEQCDDGNQQSGDCCSSACQFEAAGTSCSDAPCAVQRVCDGAGICGNGVPLNCDDANPCTDDACDSQSGCTHTPNVAPCEDGNACTTGKVCRDRACTGGTLLVCDDGNPCTDDSCTPQGGCVTTPNTEPCDDGDACTTEDACAAGACTGGFPPDCDDGNECTIDTCAAGVGCTTAPVPDGTTCGSDLNGCTTDRCEGGTCSHQSVAACANLGDADCDGRAATPIDAQVILCLAVGRCVDENLPAPCNDPQVRRLRSDWNLDGAVDPLDAAIALRVFVRRGQRADTPLGACCTGAAAAMPRAVTEAPPVSPSSSVSEGVVSTKKQLTAGQLVIDAASVRAGEKRRVTIRTRRPVALAATNLHFAFDPGMLELITASSKSLSRFTYHADNREGTLRTASASSTADRLLAGDVLLKAVFRIRPDAQGVSQLILVRGAGAKPGRRRGATLEPIPLQAADATLR